MDDAEVLKKRGYIMGINLGEGSYAKVKSAYSERLKCNVAVKIIDKKKAPRDFLERFLPREIEMLARVKHHAIVKTYEIFETSEGKVYIVTELGVHGDLLEFIKKKGAIPEEIARKMFHQLASAIKYCHELDIVHRDLKCENLLLDKEYNIKLTDFGFSKRLTRDGDGRVILSKTFCGSAAYAAPEVLQGIPYQPKVYDIWSLGVVLFIMVCGSMPYDDSNIKKMLKLQKEHRVHFPRSKALSVECRDLIYHMLQPDVSCRLCIDEVLMHIWMQEPKTISDPTLVKSGECSHHHNQIKAIFGKESGPEPSDNEQVIQEERHVDLDNLSDQMKRTSIFSPICTISACSFQSDICTFQPESKNQLITAGITTLKPARYSSGFPWNNCSGLKEHLGRTWDLRVACVTPRDYASAEE